MKIPNINLNTLHKVTAKLMAACRVFIGVSQNAKSRFFALDRRYQRAGFILIAIIFIDLCVRLYGFIDAKYRSEAASHTIVAVVSPTIGGVDSNLSFPGRLEAYLNAPIYSRVNGYLKKWDQDIGADVKKGDVLGEIEAPEIDQQLQQAKSDLISAKSAEELAKISYQRWKNLLAMDAVSKQEFDQKATEYEARKSLRQIAEANLEKAKTFTSYKNIPAPFSGLVTERNTDVGALVTAGAGKPLFNIANIDRLRVYLNIPQIFKNDISPGMTATIQVPEYPSRVFEAKVVRSSGAVNEGSGTILVEIELDNSTHILTAGEYAQIHVNLPSDRSIPRVPASALMIRKTGVYLAVVDQAQKAEFVKIDIGRDFGQEVEVIGPINESTRVINNPPDSLVAHAKVDIAKSASVAGGGI